MSPVTFRLPGPLAIAVAQVDQMSGGRAELGLGTGWFDAEHTAYGIPFPPLGECFARLEEQLEIITGLWETRRARRSRSAALVARRWQLGSSSWTGSSHDTVLTRPALTSPPASENSSHLNTTGYQLVQSG